MRRVWIRHRKLKVAGSSPSAGNFSIPDLHFWNVLDISSLSNECKLSLVQLLNTKYISAQLSTPNIQNDSIQSVTLLYSTVTMMVFVRTYGTVTLLDFDSIDESFEFRKELVPKTSHQDHQECFAR